MVQVVKSHSVYLWWVFFPELIGYETVVRELEADTLCNGASIGVAGSKFSAGSYAQFVTLNLKVIILVIVVVIVITLIIIAINNKYSVH